MDEEQRKCKVCKCFLRSGNKEETCAPCQKKKNKFFSINTTFNNIPTHLTTLSYQFDKTLAQYEGTGYIYHRRRIFL
jgi:hypothetical protein